jgi:hypothetical protein
MFCLTIRIRTWSEEQKSLKAEFPLPKTFDHLTNVIGSTLKVFYNPFAFQQKLIMLKKDPLQSSVLKLSLFDHLQKDTFQSSVKSYKQF